MCISLPSSKSENTNKCSVIKKKHIFEDIFLVWFNILSVLLISFICYISKLTITHNINTRIFWRLMISLSRAARLQFKVTTNVLMSIINKTITVSELFSVLVIQKMSLTQFSLSTKQKKKYLKKPSYPYFQDAQEIKFTPE